MARVDFICRTKLSYVRLANNRYVLMSPIKLYLILVIGMHCTGQQGVLRRTRASFDFRIKRSIFIVVKLAKDVYIILARS